MSTLEQLAQARDEVAQKTDSISDVYSRIETARAARENAWAELKSAQTNLSAAHNQELRAYAALNKGLIGERDVFARENSALREEQMPMTERERALVHELTDRNNEIFELREVSEGNSRRLLETHTRITKLEAAVANTVRTSDDYKEQNRRLRISIVEAREGWDSALKGNTCLGVEIGRLTTALQEQIERSNEHHAKLLQIEKWLSNNMYKASCREAFHTFFGKERVTDEIT